MEQKQKNKIRDTIKETIKNYGVHGLKGRKLSQEHKDKIRLASIKNGSKPPTRSADKKYPHSEETKRKISLARTGQKLPKSSITKTGKPNYKNRGEKCHLWRGGITPLNTLLRQSMVYKIWKRQVIDRDGYICQKCGIESKQGSFNLMQVDHIYPFAKLLVENNISTLEKAEQCKELWDINNGRILCKQCHINTDTYAGRTTIDLNNYINL